MAYHRSLFGDHMITCHDDIWRCLQLALRKPPPSDLMPNALNGWGLILVVMKNIFMWGMTIWQWYVLLINMLMIWLNHDWSLWQVIMINMVDYFMLSITHHDEQLIIPDHYNNDYDIIINHYNNHHNLSWSSWWFALLTCRLLAQANAKDEKRHDALTLSPANERSHDFPVDGGGTGEPVG